MAEPEELISDAARHATVFAQRWWRRHRRPAGEDASLRLSEVAERLDLLIVAMFGQARPIRTAQPPAPPTLLGTLFGRSPRPSRRQAIPATDGARIWLPADSGEHDAALGLERYRIMALQQALRAQRGSAAYARQDGPPLVADLYLLLEANAADAALAGLLPGLRASLSRWRHFALAQRPPLAAFSQPRQVIERALRQLLEHEWDSPAGGLPLTASPEQSMACARGLIAAWGLDPFDRALGDSPLLKDAWTGELLPAASVAAVALPAQGPDEATPESPRSARLRRRPQVRDAQADEDDDQNPGAWMVQPDEPHQQAEDPMGLNRPVDRDQHTNPDEFGDMLSDLDQARLVSTPERPREVLLCDDPPEARARTCAPPASGEEQDLRYPEWDYRQGCYAGPGARVQVRAAGEGSQAWVDSTLATHHGLLALIRRRFEMLQSRRVWRRRQLDGEEIDLAAYIDSYASYRAGGTLAEGLYQSQRKSERQLAIMLLIDSSGSTDSWVSSNRRIIDVEREALLLVGIALQGLGEPYAIQAFSGQGPEAVSVRPLKAFDEPYSNAVALRISALEPEHYTRAGAAIRHACATLMRQPAAHRLLLLLSDGKPSDQDIYEGRYGVEDMRQAVIEATLQGISPFCLTIDRQAAAYLPRIFGAHQYALLSEPERLPLVLLEWMKRLVSR